MVVGGFAAILYPLVSVGRRHFRTILHSEWIVVRIRGRALNKQTAIHNELFANNTGCRY